MYAYNEEVKPNYKTKLLKEDVKVLRLEQFRDQDKLASLAGNSGNPTLDIQS